MSEQNAANASTNPFAALRPLQERMQADAAPAGEPGLVEAPPAEPPVDEAAKKKQAKRERDRASRAARRRVAAAGKEIEAEQKVPAVEEPSHAELQARNDPDREAEEEQSRGVVDNAFEYSAEGDQAREEAAAEPDLLLDEPVVRPDEEAPDDSPTPGYLEELPHPVHAAAQTKEERYKQAKIEQLVAYFAPAVRHREAERLWSWDITQVERTYELFVEEYGDPTYENSRHQLNAQFLTLTADPVHREAVRQFEEQGGSWHSLVSEMSKLMGNSVVVDKLDHTGYRNAARAAFEDLSVLSRAVQQVEPYLLYYQQYESLKLNSAERALMSPSLNHLLWILKSIGVHVKVSSRSAEQHEAHRRELQRRLDERSETVLRLRAQLDAQVVAVARDRCDYHSGPVLVYENATGRFLSRGTSQETPRLVMNKLCWVEQPSAALPFATREEALAVLDNMLAWLENRISRHLRRFGTALPETIAGVPIAAIRLSSMQILRPLA